MSFLLLAAYATGITAALHLAPWTLSVQCLVIGGLGLLWALLRALPLAWIPLLGLLFVAGHINTSQHLVPPTDQRHISHFADNTYLVVEGELKTVERRESGGFRLLVDAQQIIKNRLAAPIFGKIMLYVKQGDISARSGQIIRWRSRLRQPGSFGNPGEFNYPRYLAARGIYATAFLENAEDLVGLCNHPRATSNPMENFRHNLAQQIEANASAEAAGYLQSLLLGKRDNISQEQRQTLAESGVAHLFAISGLHFGLLALMLFTIGKWIYTRSQKLTLWCPPQRILPLLLIFPLFGYLLLTGNAWGTRRAFLMIAVVAIFVTRNRRTKPSALLAVTALGILAANPLALFQPGFQLSFSGVAGILAWVPSLQKPFEAWPKPFRVILTMVLTTAAATLATAPACLWHFHQFSPAGLLSNLVAIPLLAWGSVPLGLLSLAGLSIATPIAEAGLAISGNLVTYTIALVKQISQWPGLQSIPCYLTTSDLIFLLGCLVAVLPYKRSRAHWPYRAVIILTAACISWLSQPSKEGLNVTAISVGQGDATLLSLGKDIHYLVDGGGLPGSSIDTGEQLVAPALGRLGIKALEGVILTHNHPDHSSGLPYLLNRFPIKGFYTPSAITTLPANLQNALRQHNIPAHLIAEGWTHKYSRSGLSLHMFVPSQSAQDINERSMAVLAKQHNEGVLLTADLGKYGLEQMLSGEIQEQVSLLKLPHHGSRHARPELYLETFLPQLAFVSCGRNNVYGFPHQQTLAACEKRQLPLYRTDHMGMLSFHLLQGEWQIRMEKN